jgi:prolyl oligopeptidase
MADGVRVADPYRWLESSEDSAVRRYMVEQDSVTLLLLRGDPLYERVRAAVRSLALRGAAIREVEVGGGRAFYWKSQAAAAGSAPGGALWMREGRDGTARRIETGVDVTAARLLLYRPSPDGRRIALGLRVAPGTSWMRWVIIDVSSGRAVDSLEGAFFGSELVWGDSVTLYYERFDAPPAADYLRAPVAHPRLVSHRLGASERDDVVLLAPAAGERGDIVPAITADGRRLVVIAHGTRGDAVLYADLARPGTMLDTLLAPSGATLRWVGGDARGVFLQTTTGAARRRIVRVGIGESDGREWRTIIPEQDEVMLVAGSSGQAGPRVIGGRLVVPFLRRDQGMTLGIFDLDGRPLHRIDVPSGGWLFAGGGGNPIGGAADEPIGYFRYIGITDPVTTYSFDVRNGEATPFERPSLPFDPRAYRTDRILVDGAGGVGIPVSLTYRTDVRRDGRRPVFVQAYGASRFVLQPYTISLTLWRS